METRSRTRALALDDSPGILNASLSADVPCYNPPIGAGAAAVPVHPGEPAWYTPAFYEELRNIASTLVAQCQAPTSSASEQAVQYGPRIDEALPGPSLPRGPRSKSLQASTRTTRAGARQASSGGQLAVTSSGPTSGVAKKKLLCPFADSSGVCCEPEPEEGSSKGCKAQVSDPEKGASQRPKPSKPPKIHTFGRPTDVDRHVLSKHMKVNVYCKRHHEPNQRCQFARYDGFQRHLRGTCLKGKTIDRETSRRYAFIPMPCYKDDEGRFVKGLSALRVAQTALSLETWLRTNFTDDIRRCSKCCARLNDEQMDAIRPTPLAVGSPRAQPASLYASEDLDEDRLPPEEEEGVDEEPFSESGQPSNLDVGPASSTGYLAETHPIAQEYPALGFSELGQRESQESSAHCGIEDPADYHGTIQAIGSDNTFHEYAGSLYQLENVPWYIDFGLEAPDPDVTRQ